MAGKNILEELQAHMREQKELKTKPAESWQENDLIFAISKDYRRNHHPHRN